MNADSSRRPESRVTLTPLRMLHLRWRLFSALLIALQVGLGMLLPVADARAEAAAEHRIHIEASSDSSCAPPHDPMACSFCRIMGEVSDRTVGAPRLPAVAGWTLIHGTCEEITAPTRRRASPMGARAPPTSR